MDWPLWGGGRRRLGFRGWWMIRLQRIYIFYCSMLLYLLFWTILGFIFHFYIIFGTNLLTGGPTQNRCFLPILVF